MPIKAFACLIAAFALALLPSVAFGDFFGFPTPDDWIKELFCGFTNGLMNMMVSVISSITASDLLVGSWTQLFGGSSNAIYRMATDICNGIVKPIAGAILAIVMLVQLIKVSQRMDSSGALPAVKDIAFLVVFFVMFSFIISKADTLCAGLYDLLNNVSVYINSYSASSTGLSNITFVDPSDVSGIGWGDFIVAMIAGLIGLILAFIAYVISLLMVYARAIQLYIYMTFSPIPMALLGFDETRSMGIGFIKNFAAVCLAGALMLFILIAFPYIVSSVVTYGTTGTSWNAFGADGVFNVLKIVAVSLLLCFALIKSGSTARDILGG